MESLERKKAPLASTIVFTSVIWVAAIGGWFGKGRSGDFPYGVSETLLIALIVICIGVTIKFVLNYLKSQKPYVSISNKTIEIHNNAIGNSYKFGFGEIANIRIHDEVTRGSIKVELNSGEKHFIQFNENLNVDEIVNFIKANSNIDTALWE